MSPTPQPCPPEPNSSEPNSTQPSVLVVGVAVLDFVFSMPELPTRAAKYRAKQAEIVGGGCAANAAVAIARLGGRALLGARLGQDPVGDLIVDDLIADGVNTDLVQRHANARSSFSSVFVDDQGERQIVNYRDTSLSDATDWINTSPKIQAILVDTRWGAGAIAALRLAKQRGVPGIVDAEAPMDTAVLCEASHVAFSRDGLLSYAPAEDLETALQRASQTLPGAWLCVTDGAAGVTVLSDSHLSHVPSFQVPVRDTLGAGDVWHGAFALALAEGQTEDQAVRFSNAAAAIKCTMFGGRKGSPDRAALETFLKETQR